MHLIIMVLSIFGLLFGVAGGALILGLLFLFFKFKNSYKRKYKKDVSQFKPGYQNKAFSIPGTTLTENKRKQIMKHLSDYDVEFVTGTKNELIAYLNNFKQAFLHGTQSVTWDKIAIRIVIYQNGTDVQVNIDDDYGIKKKGYEKRATPEMQKDFIQKCNRTFTFHESHIAKILRK